MKFVKMKLGFILLFTLGLLSSACNANWIVGKHYEYKINSRTLTALHEVNGLYTGILITGYLIVQPQNETHLLAQIVDSKYGNFYLNNSKDWSTDDSFDTVDFKKFPTTKGSFQIILDGGIVTNLIVNSKTPTWELNYIKSIISQIQVNSRVVQENEKYLKNELLSRIHNVMENSIYGNCENLYDISPLSESMILSNPHYFRTKRILHKKSQLNDKSLLITKTKNFSNCNRRISYKHGFIGKDNLNLETNANEQFMSHSSVSRIVVSDYENDFLIESSETSGQIIIKPSLFELDFGIVRSQIRIEIANIENVSNPLAPVTDSQSTGNLIYTPGNPFELPESRHVNSPESGLEEAPHLTLLPFFIGNEGNVIWKNKEADLSNIIQNLAYAIACDLKQDDVMTNHTTEKMTILTRIVRTMNIKQIKEISSIFQNLKKPKKLGLQEKRKENFWNAWTVFRTAVSQAGTGPALLSIKTWIEKEIITDYEAKRAIVSLSKSIRTPSSEYLNEFLLLMELEIVKNSNLLFNAAALALVEKYCSYLAENLKNAVDNKNSNKIQTLIFAIGKTAYISTLYTFKPYLDNKIPVTKYQRTLMVLSLRNYAKIWPTVVRPFLYNMYIDTNDYYEVRCAAVFVIMMTNPPIGMLQRMADFTNYDPSLHVSSVVKSAIISASTLGNDDELGKGARAAMSLLNSKVFEHVDSKNYFSRIFNEHASFLETTNIHFIGSHDDLFIKEFNMHADFSFGGITFPNVELGGTVSSIGHLFQHFKYNLIDKVQNGGSNRSNCNVQSIADILGLRKNDMENIEGAFYMNTYYDNIFIPFDNSSFDDLIKSWKKLAMNWQQPNGYYESDLTFSNYDMILSFPTESGFPFVLSMEFPQLQKTELLSTLKSDFNVKEDQNFLPSAQITQNINMIISSNMQGRIGFVAAFENKYYMTGYDNRLQLRLPVKFTLEYSSLDRMVSFKVEPLSKKSSYHLVELENVPFTTELNLLKIDTVGSSRHTRLLKPNNLINVHFDAIPGITWDSEFVSSKEKDNNFEEILESLKNHFILWNPKHIQWTKHKFAWDTEPEVLQAAKIRVSIDTLNNLSNEVYGRYENIIADANDMYLKDTNHEERVKKLLKSALSNITYGRAIALDSLIELSFWYDMNFLLTAALGYSNIDKKFKALGYFKAELNETAETLEMCVSMETKLPSQDVFHPHKALNTSLSIESQFDVNFGISDCHSAKFKVQAKLRRSEKRKNDILNLQKMQDCLNKHENILIHCADVFDLSSVMDEIEITLIFDNSTSWLKVLLLKLINSFTSSIHSGININMIREKRDENKLSFKFHIRDFDAVDIYILSSDMDITITNINPDNLLTMLTDLDNTSKNDKESMVNYRDIAAILEISPYCLIDDTKSKTFDGKVYNMALDSCWYVLMTWNPNNTISDISNVDIIQNSQISILLKNVDNGKRELKVLLGCKEVIFYPYKNVIFISVNNKTVDFDNDQFYHCYDNIRNETIFEIFTKDRLLYEMSSSLYGIELAYDGKHLRIEISNQYRDSISGLCGNFNSETEDELRTPSGHLEENDEAFVYSWMLKNTEC